MRIAHEHDQQDPRRVRIAARSFFKEMRDQGYSTEQIVGVSSELLQLLNKDLKKDLEPAE